MQRRSRTLTAMTDTLHVVCPHCDTTNRVARARLADGATCGSCRKPLFDGHPFALNAASFDRHVNSADLPLVVDFWAPWCGPCRAMAPAYEQAAAALAPDIRLAKVDTEAEPALAARFGIRSIPTLVVFRNGREVARQSGAAGARELVQWIRASAARATAS
jgi:thioredoxin 2